MSYITEWIQQSGSEERYLIVSASEISDAERARAHQLLNTVGGHEDVVVNKNIPNMVFLDHNLNRPDVMLEVVRAVMLNPAAKKVEDAIKRMR